ncbi:MAG: DUF815 domain-containing protein, partial [Rhodospirillaceae bacterium]
VLPQPLGAPDWSASIAWRYRKRSSGHGTLEPVRHVGAMRLADLKEIDPQKEKIERNTQQFVQGKPANNVLLTGARGTGKSSLIKACLNAYAAEGHVLFHVLSMPDYGKLSGRNRDEMIAGARVEVAPYKRDPSDFVLWKPSTGDQPGWESPWGFGRPGWHLECSAMSEQHLGASFDIHGGGVDLVFPHHENEIAQSRCAHPGASFANYWVHNGYLMSEGEKMSKSLGNFYTVSDLLDEFPGEALRLAILKTHYRQPLDFTKDGVREARQELNRFYRALGLRADALEDGEGPPDASYVIPADVVSALQDDLNTPLALAGIHAAADAVFAAETPGEVLRTTGALKAAGRLLGLLQSDPGVWFQGDGDAAIDALIAERLEARAAKDFERADQIRDDLAARGIVLEDGAGGTTWRREG